MSQLVAYYDENPIVVKGKVEINQSPISAAAGLTSVEGVVRTALVYVVVHRQGGSFLVPLAGC